MSDSDDLTATLLSLKRGQELKAFRRTLSKQQAIEAVSDPRVTPLDRAAINLAAAFASANEQGPWYHWSPQWGFGDSVIIHPEELNDDASEASAQSDRRT